MQTAINMDSGSGWGGSGGTDWTSLAAGLLTSQDSGSGGSMPSTLDMLINPVGSYLIQQDVKKQKEIADARAAKEFDRRQRMLDLIEDENNRKNKWWKGLRSSLENFSFTKKPEENSDVSSLNVGSLV